MDIRKTNRSRVRMLLGRWGCWMAQLETLEEERRWAQDWFERCRRDAEVRGACTGVCPGEPDPEGGGCALAGEILPEGNAQQSAGNEVYSAGAPGADAACTGAARQSAGYTAAYEHCAPCAAAHTLLARIDRECRSLVQLRETVEEMLARMKAEQAQVIRLRYSKGLSWIQIGLRMHCDSSTARRMEAAAVDMIAGKLELLSEKPARF